MDKTWGARIWEEIDKIVLVCLYAGNCFLVLHISHDGKDEELILWAREASGTILGALLGLITGHALATRATAITRTGQPPQSGGPPPTITTTTMEPTK